ncbi:RNA-binding protein [Escherichia phage Phagiculus]
MIHELKILPVHFDPVDTGLKLAELRKNDRNFSVGDKLILKEFHDGAYTGRITIKEVLHIADVSEYLPGYVLLSMY